MSIRAALRPLIPAIVVIIAAGFPHFTRATAANAEADNTRPNILFCIADDWGWPHAGAYGDAVVKTPAFDRVAKDGVLFHHAYVSSPSCTPSRGAIITGQYHWRLEGAANLWSVFPDKFATYPEMLEEAGYHTGYTGKAWGPGQAQTKDRLITGARFKNFKQFMEDKEADKPFAFWLGTSDPHRPYKAGSGVESGMDLSKVHLFAHYPDNMVVRSDVADYYWEVQRFDALVGHAIKLLEDTGQLDNTIIVITGDHGMPFPRCKSNLYDSGTRVPLAIMWGQNVKGGREVEDFVSLCDLAPTFLEAAGVDVPKDMTGRSLMNILTSDQSGRVDPSRDNIIFGKDRHVPSQELPDTGGYPCRAIRTQDFLYIRNFTPERWPAGTPNYEKTFTGKSWYADCDGGPTKTYIIHNKDKDESHARRFELCFAKRPAEELYDLTNDPDQINNVAADLAYADVREQLAEELITQLRATKDPRIVGGVELIDNEQYLGGGGGKFEPPPKE